MIFNRTQFTLAVGLASLMLAGCNVGTTAAGGSDEEVKAAFDAQPIDVRAKQIMGSPAPTDFKLNRIKEMYEKEGKPVPPEFHKAGNGAPGGPR